MGNTPRIREFLWGLIAAALLVGAGIVQYPLSEQGREYELNPPEVARNYPGRALLMMAPGGLRAPIVNYLWIRSQQLKDNGRHYEAMQLADFICKLQPSFAGVWGFHAWNMAWNISVTTHTPQERWLWVYNSVKLLRDGGIPHNRKSVRLYMDLGWIFFMKMGLNMDEMHMVYKQRWAAMMQELLGAPPQGSTVETIDAFRPIAEAPLDKDLTRQGKDRIQKDQLDKLLLDPSVAAYAKLLDAQGVKIGEDLLLTYNRYSRDESIEVTSGPGSRFVAKTQRERALGSVINSAEHTEARNKLLCFVRAQILWNVYKMDPQWMLGLMEKYGPLDWRLVQPHGMYWTSYGLHVCENLDMGEIDTLNTGRTVINSLKALTWMGRLTYIRNGNDPEYPFITMGADWRMIEPTHDEYVRMGGSTSQARGKEFEDNIFRNGHINYLARAIQMLYAGYRRQKAQEYLDWVKEAYGLRYKEWDMNLDDFVIERLHRDEKPIERTAYSQIHIALQVALLQKAAGSARGYRDSINYAYRVHRAYHKDAPRRTNLPPMSILMRDTAARMFIEPRTMGINMDLVTRSNLYARMDPKIQLELYDLVTAVLERQCEQAGIDFAKAFPPPGGLEEFRARQLSPVR